jgi:zinc-binding alcohol dehydrogenase/oxidoreductase
VKTWILDESPGSYRLGEVPDPEPGVGEVRLRLVASALNHMDVWVTKGLPKPHVPHVPGADGAGVVDAVGEGVEGIATGDEVVLNPAVACGRCRQCLRDQSPLCASFGILGEHRWGTHGELVVVPVRQVLPKPGHRSWEECAAYGLCALTAWRMLKRARLTAGETLLVVGVGGGVSSFGLLLGIAMGATVVVTSRDEAKRANALAIGAAEAYDSDDDRWPVRADVVFENVGPPTWDKSLRSLVPGGRLVTCGGTAGGKVEISLPRLFFKQHELIGSTMGSYSEFDEVTSLVARGLPVPVDQIFPVDDYPAALGRLEEGAQLGKIVRSHRPRHRRRAGLRSQPCLRTRSRSSPPTRRRSCGGTSRTSTSRSSPS